MKEKDEKNCLWFAMSCESHTDSNYIHRSRCFGGSEAKTCFCASLQMLTFSFTDIIEHEREGGEQIRCEHVYGIKNTMHF